MSVLLAERISFRYPTADNNAIDDFTFSLQKGEFAILHARNGSGKSTLLRILTGQLQPDAGSLEMVGVRLNGSHSAVRKLRRSIGLVHHDVALLDDRTVTENLLLSLQLGEGGIGMNPKESVQNTLLRLDLKSLEHSYPPQLSLGQRQRVALARAVLREPQLLIIDEPFLQLDSDQRALMKQLLVRENLRGMTILLMTTESDLDVGLPVIRKELGS